MHHISRQKRITAKELAIFLSFWDKKSQNIRFGFVVFMKSRTLPEKGLILLAQGQLIGLQSAIRKLLVLTITGGGTGHFQ